jgi:signal peptidase I
MADESKSPDRAQNAATGGTPADGRARRAGRAFVRELVVPIVLALFFIQFVVQAFKIPSASMERSLLIGDFLLGLKFIYGAPVPFTDARLPALTDPRPDDVLIFRYPGDPAYPEGDRDRYAFVANLFLFGNLYWDRTPGPGENRLVWYAPKDFIKRAVAQSGQTLEIDGATVRVDGRPLPLPPDGLYTAGTGARRLSDPVRDHLRVRLPVPGETIRLDTLSVTHMTWIRSLAHQENPGSKVELVLDLYRDGKPANDYVMPVVTGDVFNPNHHAALFYLGLPREEVATPGSGSGGAVRAYNVPFTRVREAARTGFLRGTDLLPPHVRTDGWRRSEFNEYYMGSYLELFAENLRAADGNFSIRPKLVIDGVASDHYTVRHPVYFMMGDNRDNSSDSRYWGFLSREYVKAKALIVYYSFENENRAFSFANPLSWFTIPFKIRWTRLGLIID